MELSLIVCFFSVCSITTVAPDIAAIFKPPEIGFLEETVQYEPNERSKRGKAGPALKTESAGGLGYRVRLAFKWNPRQKQWISYGQKIEGVVNKETFPFGRQWNVLWHNRKVGSLNSTKQAAQNNNYPSDWGTTNIEGDKEPPHIGPRTLDFAGWKAIPVIRPLVLTSNSPCPLQNAYQKQNISHASIPHSLLSAFQAVLDRWIKAQRQYASNIPEDIKAVPADLVMCEHYYLEKEKKHLYRLDIAATSQLLQWGEDYDALITQHWFHQHSNGDILYLGADMKLLDYGDFNCNGKCDFIFFFSQYNQDGYKLFWDDFKKNVDFIWTYH